MLGHQQTQYWQLSCTYYFLQSLSTITDSWSCWLIWWCHSKWLTKSHEISQHIFVNNISLWKHDQQKIWCHCVHYCMSLVTEFMTQDRASAWEDELQTNFTKLLVDTFWGLVLSYMWLHWSRSWSVQMMAHCLFATKPLITCTNADLLSRKYSWKWPTQQRPFHLGISVIWTALLPAQCQCITLTHWGRVTHICVSKT